MLALSFALSTFITALPLRFLIAQTNILGGWFRAGGSFVMAIPYSQIGKGKSNSRASSTSLTDYMTDLEDSNRARHGLNGARNLSIPLFHYPEVTSTMDTARELIKASPIPHKIFAVTTSLQHKGRGTKGRKWQYGSGNLFMTLCINKTLLPPTLPLHYLPLRTGTLIASALMTYITSDARLKLKWPNDILLDGQKVSLLSTK